MAVALHERGTYGWDLFSGRLAAHVASLKTGQSQPSVLPVSPETESRYYEAWLAALEDLLVERGVISVDEIEEMTAVVASGVLDHS